MRGGEPFAAGGRRAGGVGRSAQGPGERQGGQSGRRAVVGQGVERGRGRGVDGLPDAAEGAGDGGEEHERGERGVAGEVVQVPGGDDAGCDAVATGCVERGQRRLGERDGGVHDGGERHSGGREGQQGGHRLTVGQVAGRGPDLAAGGAQRGGGLLGHRAAGPVHSSSAGAPAAASQRATAVPTAVSAPVTRVVPVGCQGVRARAVRGARTRRRANSPAGRTASCSSPVRPDSAAHQRARARSSGRAGRSTTPPVRAGCSRETVGASPHSAAWSGSPSGAVSSATAAVVVNHSGASTPSSSRARTRVTAAGPLSGRARRGAGHRPARSAGVRGPAGRRSPRPG